MQNDCILLAVNFIKPSCLLVNFFKIKFCHAVFFPNILSLWGYLNFQKCSHLTILSSIFLLRLNRRGLIFTFINSKLQYTQERP
jgi:hypothetical protein